MRTYAESSPSVVTPLNKYVGYENAAKIAKQALADGATIRETVLAMGYVERGDLTEEQLDEALDVESDDPPVTDDHRVTGASDGIGLHASSQIAEQGSTSSWSAATRKPPPRSSECTPRGRRAPVESSVRLRGAGVESASSPSRPARDAPAARRPGATTPAPSTRADPHRRRASRRRSPSTTSAAFLLTELLHDRLIASASARIVSTSSVGHYRGTMDFDDLGFERGYRIMRAYGRSKLANVLYARYARPALEPASR